MPEKKKALSDCFLLLLKLLAAPTMQDDDDTIAQFGITTNSHSSKKSTLYKHNIAEHHIWQHRKSLLTTQKVH